MTLDVCPRAAAPDAPDVLPLASWIVVAIAMGRSPQDVFVDVLVVSSFRGWPGGS